jgi:hypothetical protein
VTIDGNEISSSNQNEVASIGSGPFTLSAAGAASDGSTTYAGTITSGASNALVGLYFTTSGFNNAGNNVANALCTASTTTTLTLTNGGGVAETNTGSAAFVADGILISAMSYVGSAGYGGLIISNNTIGNLYGESNGAETYGINYASTRGNDVVISGNNLDFNVNGPLINSMSQPTNYSISGNMPQAANQTVPGLFTSLSNNLMQSGSQATVASAAMIAPTTPFVIISGVAAIATVTPSGLVATNGGCFDSLATGAWSTTNKGGNIYTAMTATTNTMYRWCYLPSLAKWVIK